MRDTDDEVELIWVSGDVNIVPPWALVVGHTLEKQPIMLAMGYVDGAPQKLGLYANGSSCAEYRRKKDGLETWCVPTWKIATLKPCK